MKKRRGAFTLLEILVVLAVLGMGLALVSAMMRNSAQYSERVEEDSAVQLVCDNMMSSILSGGMTATIGVELPIPDAPRWTVTTELRGANHGAAIRPASNGVADESRRLDRRANADAGTRLRAERMGAPRRRPHPRRLRRGGRFDGGGRRNGRNGRGRPQRAGRRGTRRRSRRRPDGSCVS